MPQKPILPRPDLVDDIPEDPFEKPWRVYEDSQLRGSFADKEFYAPSAETDEIRYQHAKEMMHKISPDNPALIAKKRKLNQWALEFCEDWRVRSRLKRLDNPIGELTRGRKLPSKELALINRRIEEATAAGDLDIALKAKFYAHAHGIYSWTRADEATPGMEEAWQKLHELEWHDSHSPENSFERGVIPAARIITTLLKNAEEASKAAREASSHSKSKSRESLERGDETTFTPEGDEALESKIEAEIKASLHPRSKGRWGKMHIRDYAREVPAKLRAMGLGKRVALMGTRIGQLHRILTDQRVFFARHERRGGTILIDISGSMSWDMEQLWEMIQVAPHGKVAVYSGVKDFGYLSIMIRNGRACTKSTYENNADKISLGGNIIDGPALRWLGKQEGPRLWVCDNIVTGVDDNCYPSLNKDADVVRRRCGIERVDHFDQAIAHLKQRYGKLMS